MDKKHELLLSVVHISAYEATFEIINDNPYYASFKYDVYVNRKLVLENQSKNVFSIFGLKPDTKYHITVCAGNLKGSSDVKTTLTSKVYSVSDLDIDSTGKTVVTSKIQELIDNAINNSIIYFPKGIYLITPLFVKSNLTIYLEKDAILLGDIDRNNYPIIPGIILENGKNRVGGSWEGASDDNYASLITGIGVDNFSLIGEGVIDGNAQNGDWWVNHKVKRGAWRPHDIFFNRSRNIDVVGLNIKNSASWTIHPYYSDYLRFINLNIEAIRPSPNTDGIDPESCHDVLILGVDFNTGDDCIAIKSGKMEMVKDHYKPSSDIVIRNCHMGDGHGGVVFGSEASSGIYNVKVDKCYFDGTDRGFRIKTRRGRGNKAKIEDVCFNNIIMNNVKNALVINMFYYCDADGKSDYVQAKYALPIDERTPSLGKFVFENMKFLNTRICAGYFYGLPEAKIEEIDLRNIEVTYTSEDVDKEEPAMMLDCEAIAKGGFFFRNVSRVEIDNVNIRGQIGKEYNYEGDKYE